jgi:hypothetical protein
MTNSQTFESREIKQGKEIIMDTKKKAKLLSSALVSTLVLTLTLTSVVGVWAADVGIDDFSLTSQSIYYVIPASPTFPHTESSFASASEALGGHRDLCLTFQGGNQDASGTFQVSSANDYLDLSLGSSVTAQAVVQWDGTDANCTIDPIGLQDVEGNGEDLTDVGSNDGLLLRILASDGVAVDIVVTIWTDASDWAEQTVQLDSQIASGQRVDIFLPFDDFEGGTGTMNPADVGAVELEIDGTVEAGPDLTVDLFKATSVREYGDLPSSYGTSILNANHIPGGLRLGNSLDTESSDNASIDASGDDTDQTPPDDEDGVSPYYATWSTGSNGQRLTVIVNGCLDSGGCYVNGWIDWNNDGDFDDTDVGGANEHVLNEELQDITTYRYYIDCPSSFLGEYVYARFRVCESTSTCNSVTVQEVLNGEVEDYRWDVGPTVVNLSSLTADWDGDQVVVAWETAMEVNTVGFNVWRSTSADKGYVQVNSSLIPAESLGGVMGGSYSFADASVAPGMVYYYKLEELEVGGASNWYGPTSTSGSGPTAVTLSAAATALAWWPAAAGVLAGGGLMTFVVLRRRRQHQ